MTTPTGVVARLLAMAEEHERKGAALRLAATELHGEKVASKKNGFDRTLAGAIELRAGQKPASTPEPMNIVERQVEREKLITAFLTEHPGPQRAVDITAMLAAHGHSLSRDGVRRVLGKMPTAISRGRGYTSRWELAPPRVEPHKPRARKALSYSERKAASRDKAEKLAIILKEAGRPLSTAELSAAAREVGITSMTGIYGYVVKGWLKRTGKQKGKFRYSFVQLPSEAEAAAPPA